MNRTRFLAIAALLLFVLAPSALATGNITFQQLSPNQCSTAPYGFTWSVLGGSTGCPTGQTCVMSASSAGTVPTCMPTQAATTPNYSDLMTCNSECGHVCTSNPNSYTSTYYCGPSQSAPAQPSPLPQQQMQNSLNSPSQIQQSLNNPNNPNNPTGTNVQLLNPLQGGTSLESFMLNILAFVIRIGSIIVIFMLIYVGYLFVIARGEPGKITEARQALLWTVIGALVLLGSKAIALGIEATVNALSVGQ